MKTGIRELSVEEASKVTGGVFVFLITPLVYLSEVSGTNRRAGEFQELTGDYYYGSRNFK